MSRIDARVAIECDHCGCAEFAVYSDPETGQLTIECDMCHMEVAQ